MDIYGHPRISMDIYGYPCMSMDIHADPGIHVLLSTFFLPVSGRTCLLSRDFVRSEHFLFGNSSKLMFVEDVCKT